MFNFNGTIVSKINDAEPELVHTLKNSFSIFETVRFQNDKILFWDFHYLRMMASLRRFRFNIPKHFSFEFLELARVSEASRLDRGSVSFHTLIRKFPDIERM